MSGKDDPFGSGGKTVIVPNPGGVPRPRSGRAAARRCPAAARSQPLPTPGAQRRRRRSRRRSASGAPQPNDGLRRARTPAPGTLDAGQRRRRPSSAFFPKPAAARRRRAGARSRSKSRSTRATTAEFSAANPITAAAAPLLILLGRLRLHDRRHAGRAADEPCRAARSPNSRRRSLRGRRHPQEDAGRQIRAVRHRRRHRPEPAGHRPACLDAVLACWRSSSRCAPRASASSRS